jgi:hypothetical protein
MNVEQLRSHAEHCLERATSELDELQRMRYLRAAKAWQSLAHRKLALDAGLMVDEAAEVDLNTTTALPA